MRESMRQDHDKFTVVGLGEILWDLLPDGRQLGGAPANFAYHAQVLGAKARIVSCIGKDDLGKDILERLQELALATTHMAIDGEHPTGTVSVELNEQGKPEYVIHENVAWDFIPYGSSLEILAAKTDAVCFGSLCQRSAVSRDTVKKFLEATRPDGIRIYDINLRQSYYSREVIDDMLSRSDVLKLNDEELPIVADMFEIRGNDEEILRELQRRYSLGLIALTLGADGSRLLNSEGVSFHRFEEPITVADTIGAGDAFTAAVAIGLLQGWDIDRTNETANRLAAFVCTRKGAMPLIPQRIIADLLRSSI